MTLADQSLPMLPIPVPDKRANMTTETSSTEKRKLPNQFGDYEDVTNMTIDDWGTRWKRGQTRFHVQKIHPMLVKHHEKLTNGRTVSDLRIFMPMCGKSLDLNWLQDRGFDVVGNEFVDEACKQFFQEHNMTYETKPIAGLDGTTLFKSTDDHRIQLYCCDFFKLTKDSIGQFDCIWDRGSYAAINLDLRKRYAEVITQLMKPDCQYLLDCFMVDNEIFGGPPFNSSQSEVEENFGSECSVEHIDTRDAMGQWQREWGVQSFIENVYLLKLK